MQKSWKECCFHIDNNIASDNLKNHIILNLSDSYGCRETN